MRSAAFDLMWPTRRKNAKLTKYRSDADREYMARVRANKAKKSAEARHEREKARARDLRKRNAPILKANAEAEDRAFRRAAASMALEREAERITVLAERVRAARAKGRTVGQHRMLQQRLATPAWANRGAIMSVYAKAKRMQGVTGIEHHVDHVVPIVHKLVCGLHCEANLQVLTKKENIRKLNRWWPDMPETLKSPATSDITAHID